MKNIINHLATDWYKYLLELIVITAGVVGAFSLNSWNDDRKERINSVKFLKTLSEDLSAAITPLDILIEAEQEFADFLVVYLKDKKTTDSLAALPEAELAIFDLLYKADVSSQEIMSYVDFAKIENLNLIASDHIRKGLVDLENKFFSLVQTIEDRLTVQQMRGDKISIEGINFLPLVKKSYNISSISDTNSLRTYQELLRNQEFRNTIGLKLAITISQIEDLKKVKLSVVELIKEVDNEVKNAK